MYRTGIGKKVAYLIDDKHNPEDKDGKNEVAVFCSV